MRLEPLEDRSLLSVGLGGINLNGLQGADELGGTEAEAVRFIASADGYVIDNDGDGTFDALDATNQSLVLQKQNDSGIYTTCVLVEFDLSSVTTGNAILGASLSLNCSGWSTYDTALYEVYAFSGDGEIALTDATVSSTLVGSFEGHDGGNYNYTIALNAEVLASLRNTTNYVGLILRVSESTKGYLTFDSVDSGFASDRMPTLLLTLDASDPSIAISAPALTNDNTPSITATVSDAGSGVPDGATIYLDVDLNHDGDFNDNGETGYATAAVSGGAATFDITPALADGTYNLRARVSDAAGNEGISETQSITIDTTPPNVYLESFGGWFTNNNSPLISANTYADIPIYQGVSYGFTVGSDIPAGSTAFLDVDLNHDGDFADAGETAYATATFVSQGWRGCSAAFTVAPLSDGVYSLRARAFDAADNEGTSAVKSLTVDTVAPTVTLTAPALTNDNTPAITATVSDAGSGVADGTTIYLDVDLNNDGDFNDDGETGYATATVTDNAAAFDISPTLADGMHSVQARVSDFVGNQGASDVATVFIDTVAPVVAIIAPTLTNDNTPAITATVSDAGSGVADGTTIYLDVDLNHDGDFNDDGETGYATATVTDNAAAFDITPTLADGMHSVQARVSDFVGNQGASDVATVFIDTVAPVVAIIAPTLTNDNTPAITATVSDAGSGVADGTTIYLDVDLNHDGDFNDDGETGYATSTVSGGAAAFNLTSLADGMYSLHARVTDAAGNEGTSDVATMVVDTTAPGATINQSSGQADPAIGAKPTVNFTVVFSEPVTDFTAADITLGGTAGAAMAVVTGSGTTYNVAVSGIAVDGTVVATIAAGAAHDKAGNVSVASASTDNLVNCRIAPAIAGIVVAESSASNKNGKLESTDKLLITWAASSPHGVASQTMMIDDKVTVPVKGPFSNLYYYSGIGVQTVGVHTYEITTTDANGLSSSVTGTFTVVAPTPPTLAGMAVGESGSSNKNGILESTDNLTLTWLAKSDDGIASQTVTLDGKTVVPAKSVAGTSYFYSSLGKFTVGTHGYTIMAVDVNGLSSSVSGTFTVVAPLPPTLAGMAVGESGSSNKNGILESTDNLTLTWLAKSDNGIASQTITLDGNTVGTAKSVAGTSYYYCSLGAWSAGAHSYTITTFDTAGQSSSASGSFTVLEAVAPEVSSAMRAKLLNDVLDERAAGY